MNVKRIFGSVLTVLGIAGLIYSAVVFTVSSGDSARDVKTLVVFGVLGFIFFIAGIGLVRNTKDEA